MDIRSLFAAAVVAVGFGQAANAATAKDYDLYLRNEGSSFVDYVFYDTWNDWNDYSGEFYPPEDPLGLQITHGMFPSLAPGDIVRFIATIIFPDDEDQLLGQYDNGGRAPVCSVGKTSCTNTEGAYTRGIFDAFEITYSDAISIIGSKRVGSDFTYFHYFPGSWMSDDGRWYAAAWQANANFTVVQIDDTLAPVPLPATAALLPLGIGALAVMRRRRRVV